MKLPKTTYRRIINKILRLKTYKKQKVPKYVRNQQQIAKKGCAKNYTKLCVRNGEVVLIMDDET